MAAVKNNNFGLDNAGGQFLPMLCLPAHLLIANTTGCDGREGGAEFVWGGENAGRPNQGVAVAADVKIENFG
jgi:hypothetical protein